MRDEKRFFFFYFFFLPLPAFPPTTNPPQKKNTPLLCFFFSFSKSTFRSKCIRRVHFFLPVVGGERAEKSAENERGATLFFFHNFQKKKINTSEKQSVER